MLPIPATTMTSDYLTDVQNVMVMSKLAESVECVKMGNYGSEETFVIVKGMPFKYRNFVLVVTTILRGEGRSALSEDILDEITELWRELGYKFEAKEPQKIANRWMPYLLPKKKEEVDIIRTIKTVFDEIARIYSGDPEENQTSNNFFALKRTVDFKPMMIEVHCKLSEL
jgi:hypothetical protein